MAEGAVESPNRFSISIPWDTDFIFDDDCRGTDLIWNDGPKKIQFELADHGLVKVSTGGDNYVLDGQGKLWRDHFTHVEKPATLLLARDSISLISPKPEAFDHVNMSQAVFECWRNARADYNSHLTEEQLKIVERFFDVARNAFPQQFSEEGLEPHIAVRQLIKNLHDPSLQDAGHGVVLLAGAILQAIFAWGVVVGATLVLGD